MVTIRQILEADAASFLVLCHKLDGESQFMMLEPGQRNTSLVEQKRQISHILMRGNQTILVAEARGELIGYVEALGGDFRRSRHCAQVVIGILQAFSGRGVGMRLFLGLEHWARQSGIHRMELTVMAHNDRAIRLYRKAGYGIEGTKRDSLLVNGSYVDEYYMGKLLA